MAALPDTAPYRTPPSAIAFVFVVVGLLASFLFVAFAYGHGFLDVANALVGAAVIVGMTAGLYLLACWWTRTGPFQRHRES